VNPDTINGMSSEWAGETRHTREQILRMLAEAAEGWDHNGKPTLAGEARRAIARIEGGAWSARVGHVVYLVDD
jgi:hypothetical protein